MPPLATNAKEQNDWDVAWQDAQKVLADEIKKIASDARATENHKRANNTHTGEWTMCYPHYGWEGMMWSCCLNEEENSTNCSLITDSSYGHTSIDKVTGSEKLCAGGCGFELSGWDNPSVRCSKCTANVQVLGEKAHGEEAWWAAAV